MTSARQVSIRTAELSASCRTVGKEGSATECLSVDGRKEVRVSLRDHACFFLPTVDDTARRPSAPAHTCAGRLMPWKPKRPCAEPGCRELVDGGRCGAHTRTHEQQRRPAWVTAFYSSTAWKKVRAMKRARDPLCEDCSERGVGTIATEVDHVVPLMVRRDLALELSNLRSLCSSCHAAKTRRGAPVESSGAAGTAPSRRQTHAAEGSNDPLGRIGGQE